MRKYFFVAIDETDMKEWVEYLNNASKITVSILGLPLIKGVNIIQSFCTPVWRQSSRLLDHNLRLTGTIVCQLPV